MASRTIEIQIGKHGIDDGGSILIAQRAVSDWQRPQFDRPRAPGFTTVKTTGRACIDAVFDPERYIRPWRAALVLNVFDGALAEGDRVIVTLGDPSKGGPGIRAQSFSESCHEFKILIDAFGTGVYYELAQSPFVSVIGAYPRELQITAPSLVRPGEEFEIHFRVLDNFGNPSAFFEGHIAIEHQEGLSLAQAGIDLQTEAGGIGKVEAALFQHPGLFGLAAVAGSLRGVSNPIFCQAEDSDPPLRIFWGDLHGQTQETLGTGSIDEYLSFARKVASLDFTGWQGNDFQITAEAWENVKRAVSRHHKPGTFVPFLGYEWSGLTPSGGDYNIHFLGDDEPLHRSSHWQVHDEQDLEMDRYPVTRLWETFQGRDDVLAVAHVGGRYANLDFFDPKLCPLIEVHSHHGTFEWMIEEALERGLVVGFCGGSDDHTGRPGLSYPVPLPPSSAVSFDVFGGLTAVYSSERTRRSIWQSLKSRHCYATSGARILLDVRCDGHRMGDLFSTDRPPVIEAQVTGTAPLLEVELFHGSRLLYRAPLRRPADSDDSRILLSWSGVRVKGRRKKVVWDGFMHLEGGYFEEVRPLAFDRSDEGVRVVSNQLVEFKSSTAGDMDGVLLKIAGASPVLIFSSSQVQLRIPIDEVRFDPQIFQAGGINQRVRVCQSASSGPLHYEFQFQVPSVLRGTNAFWVRVIQEDGHMAWSSPVYIDSART